ncbi:hypothetical protein FPL06_11645 [Xanthomonas citri pv. glycines]|nr:hypothetical protein BHE84_11185 [Xanthomonas citri pv. glycines str. 8ra]QDR45715.1 hypothetical protein FPK90_14345 [Xanthomonas citri pv. glycines]QTK33107.1 hypothetical protein XcgCFBP2526_13370 [Xanthomonas citri pv. glycines CFBP 2526]QDS07711.1 hypothetical protein FPL00_13270 [Xanthomonas citri pv. glycines]QDS12050.1 hypothetical protein FPL03_13525 [Xanthomonas citri pv. glycines]
MMVAKQKNAIYLSLGAPHLEYPEAVQALRLRGVHARMVHLNEIDEVDLRGVDLINVRMCRWYHKHSGFLNQIERLHQRVQDLPDGAIPFANNIVLIRDALDKGLYLRKLGDSGIDLIPTRWVECAAPLRIQELMAETGWDDIVIKPTVSSGSWRTIRLSRGGRRSAKSHYVLGADTERYTAILSRLLKTHSICVQRFEPSVLEFGELSFVFLGGHFSHAVRKTVGDQGGWWAHERLGGRNQPWSAGREELSWAQHVHDTLVRRYGWLWFDRIDVLHDRDGRLQLLECELAIPRLLLPEGQAFDRYAQVIADGIQCTAT